MSTYRNARNIYRVGPGGEEHIGCAFTEDDGRLIVLALRFAAQDLATMPPHPTCTDVSNLGQRHGTTWICTSGCPASTSRRPASTCEGCNQARRSAIWDCPLHGSQP